jgi:hypothetical protein
VRKPKAVARVYDGTCPEHGRVAVSRQGHHIDTKEPETEEEQKKAAIVVIADKPWQEVAFAVIQKNRKPTS